MSRRWLLLAPLAAFLTAADAHAQARAEPLPVTFLPGGAEADGCRRQWQTAGAVTAHTAPTDASRAVRTIDAMRRVDGNDYSESLTAVLAPGRLRVARAATMRATRLDRGDAATLTLAPGQELAWLGGTEAALYVVADGVVYLGALPAGVESVAGPAAEVWVRLVAHGEGRPEAWLNTAQAGMVEREAVCP